MLGPILDIMIVVGIGAIIYFSFAVLHALLLCVGWGFAQWWGPRQARKRFGQPAEAVRRDENGIPYL